MRTSIVALAAVLALGGCSAFPVAGPNSMAVKGSAAGVTEAETAFGYELVVLQPEAIEILNANTTPVLSASFRDRRPASDIRVGIGDVISVTIFEAAAGGLFIPTDAGSRAGNFVSLPNQTVDRSGTISVPYAGSIPAAGRRPSEIQDSIVERLRNRAIEPQAVVAVVDQRSQVVSVLGEVNSPARLPVTTTGERLLDSIARAGGVRGNGIDLYVQAGPQRASGRDSHAASHERSA